jgi:hypothetical protein
LSASQAISEELQEKIKDLFKEGYSGRSIAEKLGIGETTVRKYGKLKDFSSIFTGKSIDSTQEDSVSESNKYTEDTWEISIPKTRIRTLEELVEHCKIDLSVWEVERWECNKYEVGAVPRATKEIGDEGWTRPHKLNTPAAEPCENELGWNGGLLRVYPLFQVKAFLRKRRFATTEEYIVENVKLRSQVQKLQLRLRSESEMTNRLALNHAGYDDFIVNAKEFVNLFGDFKLPSQPNKSLPKSKVAPVVNKDHSEDAVLLLSDTHFGDKIRKEDTSGFQEFDLVISGNRMGYIVDKAKEVLTLHRAMYPIKKLYIWIGGDIGNGELHNTAISNELNQIEQVHFSYHMLKFAIEDLLTLTVPDPYTKTSVIEEIVLLFTVGNHMRVDEKMSHKLQARRTFDWLIYQFLIEKFSNTPKVTIRSEMSPFIFENIRGHRHLFCHGMQVGYKNSPDAQGKSVNRFMMLARALFDSPQWRKENGIEGETFSRACIGDIHVPLRFPRFVSNGSLNGQNELGVNWQLEPIPAGQQIFGVTEKHQETWAYFLECTRTQRTKSDMNNYGLFAAEYGDKINK